MLDAQARVHSRNPSSTVVTTICRRNVFCLEALVTAGASLVDHISPREVQA